MTFILPERMEKVGRDWAEREYASFLKQYQALKPTVFDVYRPSTILDIGCNTAFLDLVLMQHAGVKVFHLVDGDGRSRQKVKFAPSPVPWGDVTLGAELLHLNAPEDVAVFPWVIAPPSGAEVFNVTFNTPLDMIISTRSWGHHYPVETYLGMAQRCVRPGGILILDLRDLNGIMPMQVDTLRSAGFTPVLRLDDVSRMNKCKRWVFEKVPG